MSLIPVRGVGDTGVITDVNPVNLPLTAWSDAKNVRFDNGEISRYSVFKKFSSQSSYSKVPVGLIDSGDGDEGYQTTVFSDGTMSEIVGETVYDVTPSASMTPSNEQVTNCLLAGVTYANRGVDVPIHRIDRTDGQFSVLPGWDTSDRCEALRSFKDFLIAINVTKGPEFYPGMYKWSNAAQSGAVPDTWSTTDENSLAGENVLNDIKGGLVDGLAMGDVFILYGQTQTWRLDFIGEPFIFRSTKSFDNKGAIARNCVVNVSGRHYVFGADDIWVHDGSTELSISDGRVRETIFSALDTSKADRCFTFHDRIKGEIGFCYPSIGGDSEWSAVDTFGCNRAAIFNYISNTWSFVDMPAVVAASTVVASSSKTWTDMSLSWEEQAASWNSFVGSRTRLVTLSGSGNSTISKDGELYILDELGNGQVDRDLDMDVLWDAFVEKTYIDVDALGAPLAGRKRVNRLYPQISSGDENSRALLRFGVASTPSQGMSWPFSKNFNPSVDYKFDLRANRRYLGMRVEIPAGSSLDFTGYDVDIEVISMR